MVVKGRGGSWDRGRTTTIVTSSSSLGFCTERGQKEKALRLGAQWLESWEMKLNRAFGNKRKFKQASKRASMGEFLGAPVEQKPGAGQNLATETRKIAQKAKDRKSSEILKGQNRRPPGLGGRWS